MSTAYVGSKGRRKTRKDRMKREAEMGGNGPVRSEEERAARGRALKLAVKQFRASYFSLNSYNKVDLAKMKDRIKRRKRKRSTWPNISRSSLITLSNCL